MHKSYTRFFSSFYLQYYQFLVIFYFISISSLREQPVCENKMKVVNPSNNNFFFIYVHFLSLHNINLNYSTSFNDKEIRSFSTSTPITLTFTISLSFTISSGCFTNLLDNLDICINPS